MSNDRRFTGRSCPTSASEWWLYGFLLFQFWCQSALILGPGGLLRLAIRTAIFLSSVALLFLLPPAGGRPSPLRGIVVGVIAITALGLLHPQLNSQVSALGQFGITLAIWGPVLWVGRVHITPEVFRRVLLLIWGFNTLSATVGVLQVYDPDRFAPDMTFIRQLVGGAADGLMITLSDGRRVYRPMGLSDTPGGAATAGSFVILSGLGLIWQFQSRLLKCAAVPVAIIGMFCIYLCQVRSILIVTAISLLGIICILVVRGRTGRAALLALLIMSVVIGGFVWAVAVGDQAVTDRLSTLAQGSAANVYYTNRGFFLEITLFEELPKYPIGAGLGRWGMMYNYFGDPSNANAPGLYAEIQATGWVYDGGLPLLLAGYTAAGGAFLLATILAVRVQSNEIADMAAVVAAFDLGVVATTFGYPVFISQTGMMFWVLNTALFAASRLDVPRSVAIRGHVR